jgi:hypothetical protein
MGNTPKGKCRECGKRIVLDLKGTKWVIGSHNLRIAGEVNPECKGTGKKPV